jgi:tetratricopeptide (TPR) repeat protein
MHGYPVSNTLRNVPAEHQRLVYRDQFRGLFNEEFQSWFERLARALHPIGEFQAIRKTRGDGGLDGIAINAQLVYQVFAPARIGDLRDGETATKIETDFAKAYQSLGGSLKEWVFVHNHPEAKLGQLSAGALNQLKSTHPHIAISVLDIDSLWAKLAEAPAARRKELFGGEERSENRVKLIRASELINSHEVDAAHQLFKEVSLSATGPAGTEDRVTALLGLATISANRRDLGEAQQYLTQAEDDLPAVKDAGLRIHVLRLKGNLLKDQERDDEAEATYRSLLTIPSDGDSYLDEAQFTTRVDLAMLYCRTRRYELAEPLIRESEAFVENRTTKHDELLLEHVMDASLSHALCTHNRPAAEQAIHKLEAKAATQLFARRFSELLQRLGLRAVHLKAYDLGILCCEAAVRLADQGKDDEGVIAAEHTNAILLYEGGDLEAAKSKCQLLLQHTQSSPKNHIRYAFIQLLSIIANKLGDYELALETAQAALAAAGDNLTASVVARQSLAQSLCDAGQVAQGLREAQTAYGVAKNLTDIPDHLCSELLFLIAHSACLLGEWSTTEDALASLDRIPNAPDGLQNRKDNLLKRIKACRDVRDRYSLVAHDPSPLAAAGTDRSSDIHEANASVISPLLDWWTTARASSLPEARDRNLAVLYDYWGRGNLFRILLNLRGYKHTFNLVLEVHSLDEVRRAVRMFAMLTDVLVLLWKGPVFSGRVLTIVPALNGVQGGSGYVISGSAYQTPTSEDWFLATAYGSFLPNDVIAFLTGEALPLLKLGRLLVVPAVGVACVSAGHGPIESLFAEVCNATPMLKSGRAKNEFPLGYIPYFPDAPIETMAEIIAGNEMTLRRLQLLLVRRTRELARHREGSAAVRELEFGIVDALAELKDRQRRTSRKEGWSTADEALSGSSVSFNREELLRAAWQNQAGTGLYSYGTPDRAITAAEWMPVLTLASLGHQWMVTPAYADRTPIRVYRGPDATDIVGTWLAPPDESVSILVYADEDDRNDSGSSRPDSASLTGPGPVGE